MANPWQTYLRRWLTPFLYGKAHTRAFFTVGGLAWQEFRHSFSQFFTWRSPVFSLARSIQYALLAWLRLGLGRNLRFSYGYTGEDRLIESLLNLPVYYQGFYVDVGCNRPRFISNTFLLYRRGWRGICIDANPKLIRYFSYIRPRDQTVTALVGDSEERLSFYHFENDVLSTVSPENIAQYAAQGLHPAKVETLAVRSLTDILSALQAPPRFELLCIDAEEHDEAVLRSLDFSQYLPRLIVVEAEDFDPENPQKHPIFAFLHPLGYRLAGSLLKNLYFIHT